jgi:hypothetical protein
MDEEKEVAPESFADNGYTAFEKGGYRQVLYRTDQVQSWRDMGNSYFAACRSLVSD